MINYALPGLWTHYALYMYILDYLNDHPEAQKPNTRIHTIYGNFPYCIWDGGRIFIEDQYRHAAYENIIQIRDDLKKRDIAMRFIFTNPELREIHYTDHFCNLICQLCEDEKNEIVINNTGLEQYLREKYPKYSFVSSTTKCNNKDASIVELSDNKYKFVCLDYNLNHNKKFLESLTPEEKSKVEFLCNAICPSGCPNRKNHYRLNGLYYLNGGAIYSVPCDLPVSTISPECMKFPNNISPEEIESYYEPLGFSMFKLEGRTLSDVECLLNFTRYIIKPEYQYDFILQILHATHHENLFE